MTMRKSDTIPRVTHLTQFESVLDGIDEGLTFDGLRQRLCQVATDLARISGGRETSGHPEYHMWSSTKDAIEELMRLSWVEKRPLPSARHRVDAYRRVQFALTDKGRQWIGIGDAGEAREVLGRALLEQHLYFREYLTRLKLGPLFVPEFIEADIEPEANPMSLDYDSLASEVVRRAEASPAGEVGAAPEIADRLVKYVRRRFSKREPRNRKALLDAIQDAVLTAVLRSEDLRADPASFVIISSWSRELFITGNSRYVTESPGGWLHWAAADFTTIAGGHLSYVRRSLAKSADRVVGMLRSAASELKAPGTELVRVYPLRGTVAFRCGVANEVVDRVLADLVTKKRDGPYEVWVSAGALIDPPASEWPLSIFGRRYHLVGFGNK